MKPVWRTWLRARLTAASLIQDCHGIAAPLRYQRRWRLAGPTCFSEVSYLYVPAVGYVMAKAGITLHDVAYARPRQSLCVFYPTTNPLPTTCPLL
jgi:hypothetical protein